MNQANKWSKIPKYDSFAQEAVESRFSLDNNWGNWPINSNLTSSALFPDNSDDKFQNWQIEPPTTEETLSINKSLITSATSTNISIESNENQNILMNVLEGMKFWPGLFPIFLNKTIPEITANILTTTAIDANVQMNSTPEWKKPLELVRIFATQSQTLKPITDTVVHMEIQYGNEVPFGNTVNRSVQIGDNISLVIRSKSLNSKSDIYNFFVHSCYASDKDGIEKLMLIDRFGCSVQPKLTGQMIRMKNAGQTYYYFRVNAFKFPGADDVYFTCAIDMSENEHFPVLILFDKYENR
ncbi:hypothetical protein LOAG_14356 [Loa loa]|uniref:ZP domain-containing protein n=1 Tax=Loa loa TaxID=7209 RepID=A0A1S0TJ83_LOALO|nr:hypothetical protein LOAG_14356 [Loa loa]EFO14168.1 hypothetical protein LOAG_14356 [Loa loa]